MLLLKHFLSWFPTDVDYFIDRLINKNAKYYILVDIKAINFNNLSNLVLKLSDSDYQIHFAKTP